MIDSILLFAVGRMERRYGYDASYLRDLAKADPAAFRKFILATFFANHAGGIPAPARYAAKIVATRAEDCGPCTQLAVDMALEDGVPAEVVSAILSDDEPAMGMEAAIGWRFAKGLTEHRTDLLDAASAEAERLWGTRGRTGLAVAVTGSRLYPTLKAGLGHAKACQRIAVAGRTIGPARPAA